MTSFQGVVQDKQAWPDLSKLSVRLAQREGDRAL